MAQQYSRAVRVQSNKFLCCFWSTILWLVFFILGVVFTALGPDLTYDHRINDYNTEVSKYSAALAASNFAQLRVSVGIELQEQWNMDNQTAAIWRKGLRHQMDGSVTTPETDGVPRDENAIPYTGYKYTTEVRYPAGVTFFPSQRKKSVFHNTTYKFVNQDVPRIVGYNTTEQNVTRPDGSWQIQNVTEPVYDGTNVTARVRVVNSTAYTALELDPRAFWDFNAYYDYYPQRAPALYRITLNITALSNGQRSLIVFDGVPQTQGSDSYTYQADEPSDNNWMSRICVRVKQSSSGRYVIDTDDLGYGDAIDNGGCECMVYEAGYDYTNLQQRYQFPLDPLVYKSQRHPYTPNIFGDINENLESVSKIDVTLRFANDPLAFFNQKMRGNANSFGSNWYKRYNAGVGFLSFSMCFMGLFCCVAFLIESNCTCNRFCESMCPTAVQSLFPGLSGQASNAVTPAPDAPPAKSPEAAASAPAPSAAQLYGGAGHSADPTAAYSVRPPQPMYPQPVQAQPIYGFGGPVTGTTHMQNSGGLMAQYPMQQQPPMMMAQPIGGGGVGGYPMNPNPPLMNAPPPQYGGYTGQPAMAMAVPMNGGGGYHPQLMMAQPQYSTMPPPQPAMAYGGGMNTTTTGTGTGMPNEAPPPPYSK